MKKIVFLGLIIAALAQGGCATIASVAPKGACYPFLEPALSAQTPGMITVVIDMPCPTEYVEIMVRPRHPKDCSDWREQMLPPVDRVMAVKGGATLSGAMITVSTPGKGPWGARINAKAQTVAAGWYYVEFLFALPGETRPLTKVFEFHKDADGIVGISRRLLFAGEHQHNHPVRFRKTCR